MSGVLAYGATRAELQNGELHLLARVKGSAQKMKIVVLSVGERDALQAWLAQQSDARPVPMLLWCPGCHARHVDRGEFATKPHHTHACQSCGLVWRPALGPTVGVQFLPGFKDGGA